MEKRVKAEDYASQLPQHLLHHILSFLSIKQIIQTSVLSKTWYQAWNTLHILEFDFDDIFKQNRAKYMAIESTTNMNIQQLYSFVDQIWLTRRRQMISLKKFTVIMPWSYQTPSMSAIDQWIGYALESHVKELKVKPGDFLNNEPVKYMVPLSVFDSKWMQVLCLYRSKLKLPFSGNVKLPCLKKITFEFVDLDDNFIRELLAGSPMLEDIYISAVSGIKELHVSNLVKLGKIFLRFPDLEKLTIDGPNLESITLHLRIEKHKWCNSVNLGVSCKYLSISSPISDKWLNEQLKRLPHLENLELYFCPKLERIEISNPLVSKLFINRCDKLSIVQIDAPCLRYFTYIGDIVSVLSSLNRITLSEVSLHINSKNMDITWYVRLIELLANLNTSFNVLKYVFRSWTGKWIVIPEEARKMVAPPLSYVKELNLKLSGGEAVPMAQLEDAMSWIAPHAQSLIYTYQ
ncbi:putative F-box/LRR-repeat protein At4g00320 [Mercurialis annua]|uniref:putative F-box/LRR-repeat protein At4g00320 n=1 Tax=Mercurialis annua TaxID=3986 RepID=UPI002160AF50|nr:putative F-box/LRR-repeat protein At4g00320 [Mercurialis annua]